MAEHTSQGPMEQWELACTAVPEVVTVGQIHTGLKRTEESLWSRRDICHACYSGVGRYTRCKRPVTPREVPTPLCTKCVQSWQEAKTLYNSLIFAHGGPCSRLCGYCQVTVAQMSEWRSQTDSFFLVSTVSIKMCILRKWLWKPVRRHWLKLHAVWSIHSTLNAHACAPRDVAFKDVPRNMISNSLKLEITQMLIDNRKKTHSHIIETPKQWKSFSYINDTGESQKLKLDPKECLYSICTKFKHSHSWTVVFKVRMVLCLGKVVAIRGNNRGTSGVCTILWWGLMAVRTVLGSLLICHTFLL